MNRYFQQQTLFAPLIEKKPSLNLGLVLVIPVREEPRLLGTLMGLTKCTLPSCDVEVIVVVNGSETDSDELRTAQAQLAQQVREWAEKLRLQSRLRFHVLEYPDLPRKHAGVGLARKIGMDEACFRLEKIGNPGGIVACYDADSRCDKNYLIEVDAFFQQHPELQACSIYFEHPLEGIDFPDEVYTAITEYELHLRYFIHAQRFAGFPFAYQTVGSSMAVRADAYQQQGGMNRRQAGEDFYFLHKFTSLGAVGELTTTRVIPSPRPSHRVPFGTGKAVRELLHSGKGYQTYHPDLFQHLRTFCQDVPALFTEDEIEVQNCVQSWAPTLQDFLSENDFLANWREIRAHSAKPETFQNRFFRWFNAFKLMKYLHFAREKGFPDVPVTEAARWLLSELQPGTEGEGAKELLLAYRAVDRGSF
ncbi:MAG: glycosyltransferase family 2 protein [Saprospirales bacterium]|nr:glycosyltransferase family 2 protein [Saprospirales bacterium]